MDKEIFEDEPKEFDTPEVDDGLIRLPGPMLACLLFIIAFFVLVAGLGGLMAEDPHGPKGEITADPRAPWMLVLAIGAFGALMWAGIKCWNGWKK